MDNKVKWTAERDKVKESLNSVDPTLRFTSLLNAPLIEENQFLGTFNRTSSFGISIRQKSSPPHDYAKF